MTPERWRQVDQLYHEALGYEAAERSRFLEKACAGDDSLRREIESLLAFDEGSEHFMEPLPADLVAGVLANDRSTGAAAESSAPPPIPSVIGKYRILRLLGAGGMGTVYEAEQQTPHRIVALKVIKPGLSTDELLRRFELEANALGRLQHPGIAQIYEAGAADAGFGPQPYFAMEFIQGLSLLEHAEAHRLNMRERLELMAKVCEAVHHAHQRGIIHRDLKPGNILVDETGQPKILDFGVARVTDSETQVTRQTDVGQLVGTLAYMSPEQVLSDPLELDVRSDVYSLGVILYELLAGRQPYDLSRRLPEAVETIRLKDPAPLSSISRSYRGDVETMVAKALEKDRARRYASALGLASDIRHYLANEPITARPATASYQLQKFARRHKALVLGAAVVTVVLVGGIIASTREAVRANREGRLALTERDQATAAKLTATSERDRAVRAEQVSESERNRAFAEKQRADAEAAAAQAVREFLQNDLLAQADAASQAEMGTKPDSELKVRVALDRAAARIPGKFAGRPLLEAAIRQTIGETYGKLGLYQQAETHIERALELRRRLLGAEDPDTLSSMNGLGEQYTAQGKYDEAKKLLDTVLKARRRVLGEEHLDTLKTMNNLAAMYKAEGKYALAESFNSKTLEIEHRVLGDANLETLITMSRLEQVYKAEDKYNQAESLGTRLLELCRHALGEEDPLTLAIMNSLASLYRAQGKYRAAEPFFTTSLEIQRRLLGEEDPATLINMNNLGLFYKEEGENGQAEALFTHVLEIERRLWTEDNLTTLATMNNLAAVYLLQGKYAEAEIYFSKVLDIRRRRLGEKDLNTVNSLNNLAALYWVEDKYGQAEPLFTQAVEFYRNTVGENNRSTLTAKFNLAAVYRDEGKYTQAEPLLTGVLEGQQRLLTPEHPDSLKSRHAVAVLYRDEGKFDQAEPLLVSVIESRRRLLGAENRDTLTCVSDLSLLYARQGKYAEAEALFLNVLEIWRRKLGSENPDTTKALVWLSEVRLQQKKYADAESPIREALHYYERTTPDSWRRYHCQGLLGAGMAGQGKYAEAEPLLLSAYRGLLQQRATIPADSLSAIEQAGAGIVQLYQYWGKPDLATAWQEQLTIDATTAKK